MRDGQLLHFACEVAREHFLNIVCIDDAMRDEQLMHCSREKTDLAKLNTKAMPIPISDAWGILRDDQIQTPSDAMRVQTPEQTKPMIESSFFVRVLWF